MNKKKMLEMLAKREARLAQIDKQIEATDASNAAGLKDLQIQRNTLVDEIAEFRSAIATMPDDEAPPATKPAAGEQRGASPVGATQILGTYGIGSGTPDDQTPEGRAAKDKDDREKRGIDLKEGRSVTVASSSIVLPKVASNTINGTFNQVSSLVDGVDQLILNGGESFSQPYEKQTPDGTYTNEGTAAADTDIEFGYADINKTCITAYSEITNQVKKLPAADYEGVVMKGISRSSRKKLAKEIVIGSGAAGHLTGILTTAATAIDSATDLSIASITNTTLNDIIFSYGGDEDVEDQAVLILNKKDLKAFSQLRTNDGKPFHTIKTTGNTGTIDGIPYIINSAAKAVSATTTATGDYCMAYGSLLNYKLVVFSDLDVQRSTDYKFKEGMIAHRGEVYAGGNVVAYNGFLRVKKAPQA